MRRLWTGAAMTLGVTLAAVPATAQPIPTPEEFFGFTMGADGELAPWDRIVEYFQILDEASDRLQVRILGQSTLGNPFLLATFSSPENLRDLDRYREISRKLADPRGLAEEEIEELIRQGRYVSAQTYSLHATEVGGTQSTPELAFELVTSDDPTIRTILENTIFLMFPSFNPDGLQMVTEWFYEYEGTEYDNTRLPYLYHFYTGHDNNRDSYQLTQVESRMFAQVVYQEWAPQSYVDHHHMGSGSARFYIPPYLDPIHPNVDPLLWREHQLYGSHMAVALEQAGKSGFETGAPYTGWWQASFHMSTNYHNIAGMLTESASANWANPIYILPDQLGGTRGRPAYEPQMTMPRLWPGGWWRLRDIVEQQIVASKAVLELGARYRETMLRNSVLKAKGNIDRGSTQPPYAYVIPRRQHDFPTAVKLVRTFQLNGVEVHRLDEPYRVGSRIFDAGSFVVSTAQPMRSFVKSFLERVNYPDNPWTRAHRDGSPLRPYDLAAYSVAEHMGVEALPLGEPLRDARMTVLEGPAPLPPGSVQGEGPGYLLDPSSNESFRALNRLLAEGAGVVRLSEGVVHQGRFFAPGSALISGPPGLQGRLQALAEELGLDFVAAPEDLGGGGRNLGLPRVGLYKRFAGGNMDAGWTDWLLQDFEFSFDRLTNQDIRGGNPSPRYNVIIFPSDGTERIVDGDDREETPPQYRGGLGDSGVAAIREFVLSGGTLVTLNEAWDFARSTFELPLTDGLDGVPSSDFYCPGSTLNIRVDNRHPLGYGMPEEALALFRGSPALQLSSGDFEDGVSVAVRYAGENLLQSGWLLGQEYLLKKPAALEFRVGEGRVVVLAIPVQHRAQTHGTFKLLFNALYLGAEEHGSG